MKFPYLILILFLITLVVFFAGCTGPAPGPVVPVQGTATPDQGTVPSGSGMSGLALTPDEMPFAVVNARATTPELAEPAFSSFGAIRGYTVNAINQTDDSPSAVQLAQTIVEFPPGNAPNAYDYFVQQTKSGDQTRYQITWLADPHIGNQSCAFTVRDLTGQMKSVAVIAFQKGSYMESLTMIAPAPDVDALARSARRAETRIPA